MRVRARVRGRLVEDLRCSRRARHARAFDTAICPPLYATRWCASDVLRRSEASLYAEALYVEPAPWAARFTRLANESEGMPKDSSRESLAGEHRHSLGHWRPRVLQSRLHWAVFVCTAVLMHTVLASGSSDARLTDCARGAALAAALSSASIFYRE